MKRIFLFCSVIAASIYLLGSCTHEIEFEPEIPGVVEDPEALLPVCPDAKLSFGRDILPVITSHCAIPGCHDAATPAAQIDLTTYEKIMASKVKGKSIVIPGDAENSKLYRAIKGQDLIFMPPPAYYQPRNSMKEDIRKWILQGAEDGKCKTICDTTQFAFNANIKPIIDKYCTGCHNGDYPYGGILLSNYGEIVEHGKSGILLKCIERAEGTVAMPPNDAMPSCHVTQIRKWVESGMPRN